MELHRAQQRQLIEDRRARHHGYTGRQGAAAQEDPEGRCRHRPGRACLRYLTAHHVRSEQGQEGINAFRYGHGANRWHGLPPKGIPDQDPGVLVEQVIHVSPPGNVVRSYLDVVAPDEASWPEIRPAFFAFVSQAQRKPFPWLGVFGRCYFRVGMDLGVAHGWRQELADLYRALHAVYRAQPL